MSKKPRTQSRLQVDKDTVVIMKVTKTEEFPYWYLCLFQWPLLTSLENVFCVIVSIPILISILGNLAVNKYHYH